MARDVIRLWRLPDMPGVELRRGFQVLSPVGRHWHDEYQLCSIEGGGGELRHRGVAHPTPAGSLFVVSPGELHANMSREAEGCSFRTMYLRPDLLAQASRQLGVAGLPDFARPMVHDRDLIASYRSAHRAMETGAPRLERETGVLQLLVTLVERYASGSRAARRMGREREAVRKAREYLSGHFRDPVSLGELARVAGLSPFHLTRVFRQEVGLPPHAYQNQLRVHYARSLIETGQPLSLAAQMAGFSDQSHLARQFRRTFAVPPGAYRAPRSKNVQDANLPTR